jgi:hypothetical protein
LRTIGGHRDLFNTPIPSLGFLKPFRFISLIFLYKI